MWTKWIPSILISILISSPSYFPPISCYRNETLEQELTNLQWDGVSHKEILAWWDAHQRDLANFRNTSTRVFPFCIVPNESGQYPPRMKNWGPILDHIALQDERVFDIYKHFVWYLSAFTGIIKFRQFEITSKSANIGETKFTMQHWIYYHLSFKFKVRGVLVQAIVGPLGLPGGEIVTDLPCTITEAGSPNPTLNPSIRKGHFAQPCTYAPRSSSLWPTVFVYDGEPTNDISFQIRWNEAQCQEFLYYQLIVITTKSFRVDDYKAAMAPIHVIKLKGSGPYTGQSAAFPKFDCSVKFPDRTHSGVQLKMDKDYHDCLFKGKGREKGLWEWTCPPGPFECDTNWNSYKEWDKFNKNSIEILKVYDKGPPPPDRDCCELGEIPEIITTTVEPPSSSSTIPPPPPPPLPPTALKEKELTEKSKNAEIKSKVTHGGLCIFTWLVLMPLADHIARFYKDLPDILSLGLGFWTIAHVILHCFALALIWSSFGLVVGTGENSLGDVSTSHFFFGFICTGLQHVGFVSALKLFKNTRESFAFKYLALHSLGGKLGYVLAFFAILLSSSTSAMKGLSFGLLCIYLLTVGLTMYLEHLQNEILGIGFHRARCPVLQRIVMEDDAPPPMMKQKIVLLVVMVGSLFAMFLVMELIFRSGKEKDKH